jgi:hypothetical protein
MEMTLPGYTLAESLVASIVGPPTGDPFWDSLQTAVLKGAARLGELDETGFLTNTRFDHKPLGLYVGLRVFFLIALIPFQERYYLIQSTC